MLFFPIYETQVKRKSKMLFDSQHDAAGIPSVPPSILLITAVIDNSVNSIEIEWTIQKFIEDQVGADEHPNIS